MDAMSNIVRRISAFCDGGSGFEDGEMRFNSSLPNARVKRIGRIVKV